MSKIHQPVIKSWALRYCLVGAAVLLSILASAYLIRGTFFLFTSAADYDQRWVEQHYLLRGKNPLDIFQRTIAEDQNSPLVVAARDSTVEPDLGKVFGGYPPWAYATGFMFTWPPEIKWGRIWYGAGNLVLFGCILVWAWRCGRPHGIVWGWLLTAAVAAVSSICTTLGLGQYGVVVLAALAAALVLDEKNQGVLAGLAVGIALTKVTIAGPFLLPFLFKGRWKTLSVALSYITLASLLVWPMSKTNPIEMLVQMCSTAQSFALRSPDVIELLVKCGLPVGSAMKLAAVSSLLVFGVLMFFWRRAGMLVQFALAALLSRLWTTHVHCDNLVFVFLLVALGIQAVEQRSRLAVFGFLLVGSALWLPARCCDFVPYDVFQFGAWSMGLIMLLPGHPLQPADIKLEQLAAKPTLA